MSSSFITEEWRDLWSRRGDFTIVVFAYVFSTYNIFYLPSMIVNYGGLAFIVAYLISLFVVCLTLIMMELAIGQMSARAPPKALYNSCPLFKGVGISMVLYALFLLSFTGIRASYLLNYLAHMFMDVYRNPPWFKCSDSGTGAPCIPFERFNESKHSDLDMMSINLFQNNTLLNKTNTINETGDLQWMLIAGLGIVWFCVFLALLFGVRWLGKVVHITFFIPLTLLMLLMIKALSSPGSDSIISHTITSTDWNRLMDKTTWAKAFYQSLYATGLCLGSFITLASYNKRSRNLVKDSFLIVIMHLIFTVAQVITAMALLGHWLHLQKVTEFLPEMIHEGFNWSLLQFLTVVGQFSLPHVWASFLLFMFIFMLFNIMYILTLNVCSALEDIEGDYTSRWLPRLGIAFAICILGFLAGLGFTVQAGFYATELIERYLHLLTPWIILTFEIMAIGWFYCGHLLARDVRQLIGRTYCWICGYPILDLLYLLPAVPVYILVHLLGEYNLHTTLAGYKEEIADVHWTEPVGWVLAMAPLLAIPIYMVYVVARTCLKGPGDTRWEKFKYTLISPLRYEIVKPLSGGGGVHHHQQQIHVGKQYKDERGSPGYVLLPQAPLAEAEHYHDVATGVTTHVTGATSMYSERTVRSPNTKL